MVTRIHTQGSAQSGLILIFALGLAIHLPLMAGDPAEKIAALMVDLKSKDPEKRKEAEALLIKLPLNTEKIMIDLFAKEKDLAQAKRIAFLFEKRKMKFERQSQIPSVFQEHLRSELAHLPNAQTTSAFNTVVSKISTFGDVASPLILPLVEGEQKHSNLSTRAACVLAELDRAEGLSVMISALSDDSLAFLVRGYIVRLGKKALPLLQRQGLASRNPIVRQRSADLMGWICTGQGIPNHEKPLHGLMGDKVPRVGLSGLLGLANLRSPIVFEIILGDLQDNRLNNEFHLHASAVALAQSARVDDTPRLMMLAQSRNTTHQEVGVIALGLFDCSLPAQQQQFVSELLIKLLDHGSSRIQKRAAEALGSRISKGDGLPPGTTAQLGLLLRRGKVEGRYAAALAIGEASARGLPISDEIRERAAEVLTVKKIEWASGVCKEALLSVFGRSYGGNGPTKVGSAPKGPASTTPPSSNQPGDDAGTQASAPPKNSSDSEKEQASGADSNKEANANWGDGYYRPGFSWGDRSAPPLTEATPVNPKPQGVRESAVGTGGTSPSDSPKQDGNSDANKGKAENNPNRPDAEEEKSPIDQDKLKDIREENGSAGGFGNRHGKVPPGLPDHRRHRLETIGNPAKPGTQVFAGYVATN